jgi:hypothetical protein
MIRLALHVFPCLIPPVYLFLILSLQPAERLGNPEQYPDLPRLIYDDYDMTALALRGLNAARGRVPGGPQPHWLSWDVFLLSLDQPLTIDRHYFLEYPPATLLLFRLGWLCQSAASDPAIPPMVLAAWHNNIVEHWPRDESERELWRQFRRAIRVYLIVMTVCLLALQAVVFIGYEPAGQLGGPVLLLVLPASLYFALNRFDVLPALLVAFSLLCLGRRWLALSAVLLGLATLVKVYPIVLAPLVCRFLVSERRDCFHWTAVYGLTVAAGLLLPVWAWGVEAALAPFWFQLSRPAEYGWTLYGTLLPAAWADPTTAAALFRFGTVLLTGLAVFWRRPADLAGLLRRGAIVLIVFVSLQVFWSPQWVLWLAPLLVPLARMHGSVLALTVALDLVGYVSFPVVFDQLSQPGVAAWRVPLIVARFLIQLALLGVLAFSEWRARDRALLAAESPVE